MLQSEPQNIDLSEVLCAVTFIDRCLFFYHTIYVPFYLLLQNLNETEEDKDKNGRRRRKKDSAFSLEELYKKQHEEKERERMEREAVFKEKKEQREKAEARRKSLREKMFKKTRKGQPIMKYRIEHLLETIQGSAGNKS